MRILVVDDSAGMRRIIRKELEKGDYEVFEAVDGMDALDRVEECQPHLITMDVDMPKSNGFEAVTKIRTEIKPLSTETNNKVPIVFVTANDTLEGRAKGFEVGATDFITKPFSQGEVLSAVNSLLKSDNSLKGMTALIAEDSKVARNVLNNILKAEGLKTLLAEDGAKAYEIIKEREHEIDILVTDYMMPEMNGDELCRNIRTELGNKTLPVLFLSGMSERSSILEIFKAGASDYVVKPFAKEELMARIRVHLEGRMMSRKLISQVQELKRLNKLKDDFVSITSHDLRAPLNGVLGFTELLLEEEGFSDTQLEYLKHVKDSGNFLLSLINDILDLGKLQSENDEMEMSLLSLDELIQSSTNTIRHMASPKEIDLVIENKFTDPPCVNGNQNALIRVFNNILSNAIKFTPKKGHIKQVIEPVEEGQKVSISIIDNGIGIPPDKIPLLFDKFSKTSRPGTSGEKGTGLGLSITKELIERHEGTVEVSSEVDKGTCFRLVFPLTGLPGVNQSAEGNSETAGPKTPRKPTLNKPKGEQVRLLLVDDNHLNIKLATTVFKRNGYQVIPANNGKQALDAYVASLDRGTDENQMFDLIFMDLRMPRMDGFEATERIRSYEDNTGVAPIPIIAMTAAGTDAERERCKKSGMNDFVTKPINIEQIGNVIKQFIYH